MANLFTERALLEASLCDVAAVGADEVDAGYSIDLVSLIAHVGSSDSAYATSYVLHALLSAALPGNFANSERVCLEAIYEADKFFITDLVWKPVDVEDRAPHGVCVSGLALTLALARIVDRHLLGSTIVCYGKALAVVVVDACLGSQVDVPRATRHCLVDAGYMVFVESTDGRQACVDRFTRCWAICSHAQVLCA